jgi:small-conductance mechanosensitive channel
VASGTKQARNRPWRAIVTLVLAIGAAVTVRIVGIQLRVPSGSPAARNALVSVPVGHLITVTCTVFFFIVALISTFAFASWGEDMLGRFIGTAYGAIVRYVTILIGIAVVLLTALSLLGFRVGQLIVGGAVTGVLLTIAAQQSLSNVFAGVMLQFSQPFRVGDRVRIRSGALGGTIEGTVSEFSITYVRMETGDGRVLLPNSQVLAAAVGPAPHPAAAGVAPPPPVHNPGNPAGGTPLG